MPLAAWSDAGVMAPPAHDWQSPVWRGRPWCDAVHRILRGRRATTRGRRLRPDVARSADGMAQLALLADPGSDRAVVRHRSHAARCTHERRRDAPLLAR